MDGCSLLPLIRGETDSWREKILVESNSSRAILTEKWKFIHWKDCTEELYDRVNDPHDLNNLAFAPSTDPIRKSLRKHLEVTYAK